MLTTEFSNKIDFFMDDEYIKIQGISGSFVKKKGNYSFNRLKTTEGIRLFIFGSNRIKMSIVLLQIKKLALGLLCGFKSRLRLVGIGFRAHIQEISVSSFIRNINKLYIKKYRINRLFNFNIYDLPKIKILKLKIGYSHEIYYPIISQTNIVRESSRIDSRSKATILVVTGNNKSLVYQIGSEIRNLRVPNIYIGKGIKYFEEKIILKKGKRQS